MCAKNFLILCLLFAGPQFLFSQKKAVGLKLTCLQPYCGGARPTKEMEANAQKPQPYAGKMVIIVPQTGKVDSAKTAADGSLKLNLSPGKYRLQESWRYYKQSPGADPLNHYDAACLKAEWQKDIALVTVTTKTSATKLINPIVYPCDWNRPCLQESFKVMPE